jgi:predicted nucleic acid-binding protein
MAKSKAGELMAALQRARPLPEPVPVQPETAAARPKTRRGKAVQFWLHDEDRKLIRELAAYLSTQGLRPTDSLIVRAALRLAPADARLLEAFREALSQDGRYRGTGSEVLD